MAKSRLTRLFTAAMAQHIGANVALAPTLESVGEDGVEREYVFYGKMVDKNDLERATSYSDQEQYRVFIPTKEKDREITARIRKTIQWEKREDGQFASDATYHLTIKSFLKGEKGCSEAESELPPEQGQKLLEVFRLADPTGGMIKRRYVFPAGQGYYPNGTHPNELIGVRMNLDGCVWEVDVPKEFRDSASLSRSEVEDGGCWVKLDYEVKKFDLRIKDNHFDVPFPIRLEDVIYQQPGERDKATEAKIKNVIKTFIPTPPAKDEVKAALEQSVTQSIETLFENQWLSLMSIKAPEMGVTGYVFSHESRCKGRIVAVLPYRRAESTIQFLIKSEITPCWGLQPNLSALTGGWEGEEIVEDARRELLEESGYDVDVSGFVSLGECFASKSSDTVYSLFTVDLTNVPKQRHEGDGSRLEAIAQSPWVEEAALLDVMDAQVHVMLNRLKVHLKSIEK